MHQLPLSAYQSAETNTDKDEVTEGFGDMMMDSTLESGCEEIIEDDDRDCVEDDGYSMEESLGGADFEYI